MTVANPNANPNPNPNPASTTPRTICVFCGASPGKSPAHLEAARSLATVFAKENIRLVYGGGTVGLMGELARTLVSLSGPASVHGVIPSALLPLEAERRMENGVMVESPALPTQTDGEGQKGEGAGEGLKVQKRDVQTPEEAVFGKTTIVPDMHTRKRLMADLVARGGPGSGFIALSGGFGTLEELMEIVTWNQLGIHAIGVCMFNVEGYWDGIFQWIRTSVEAGFVRSGNSGIVVEAKTAEECVIALKEYKSSEDRYLLQWSDEKKL